MTDLREAYLVTGVRTPIGRYGGALATVRPDDLAAHAIRALTERLPTVDWAAIDDVVLGCANQAGEQRRHPRHVAVVLPGLVRTTENHVVDRRPVDGGQPFGQGADHVRGQVVGAHGGERPAVPADRSPYAGDEVGLSQVGHDRVPSPDPVSANSSEPPIARLLPRNSATTDPSARRTVTS